jgi:hypothetical protein
MADQHRPAEFVKSRDVRQICVVFRRLAETHAGSSITFRDAVIFRNAARGYCRCL